MFEYLHFIRIFELVYEFNIHIFFLSVLIFISLVFKRRLDNNAILQFNSCLLLFVFLSIVTFAIELFNT